MQMKLVGTGYLTVEDMLPARVLVRNDTGDKLRYAPERTCEFVGRNDGGETTVYEHLLSCGHSCEWTWEGPPSFCPACGAKVVKKRC